jgi:hypothetical protein
MTDSILLTVTVVLGVCAAVWNVLVPLPNVEATSLVVICVAMSLGTRPAIMTGAVASLLSSIAGGLGVWTSWQIVGVVVLAVVGGQAAARCNSRLQVALICGATAGLVDVLITVPTVAATMQLERDLIPGLILVGLPYTVFHIVAVAALAYALAPSLSSSLDRASQRVDRIR